MSLGGGYNPGNGSSPYMRRQQIYTQNTDPTQQPQQPMSGRFPDGGMRYGPQGMQAPGMNLPAGMGGRMMFSRMPGMQANTSGAPPPPMGTPPPPPGYQPTPTPPPFVPPTPTPAPYVPPAGTPTSSGVWGPPQGPYGGGANGLLPFNTAWAMGGPMGPTERPDDLSKGYNQITGKWEAFQ